MIRCMRQAYPALSEVLYNPQILCPCDLVGPQNTKHQNGGGCNERMSGQKLHFCFSANTDTYSEQKGKLGSKP